MTKLEDFHANGLSFPDSSREDINSLVEKIPDEGTLHLAILQPPYLDLIAEGTKTIESRINANRTAPLAKLQSVILYYSKRPENQLRIIFLQRLLHCSILIKCRFSIFARNMGMK